MGFLVSGAAPPTHPPEPVSNAADFKTGTPQFAVFHDCVLEKSSRKDVSISYEMRFASEHPTSSGRVRFGRKATCRFFDANHSNFAVPRAPAWWLNKPSHKRSLSAIVSSTRIISGNLLC